MRNAMKKRITVLLCLIIAASLAVTVYTVRTRSANRAPNPNVTLVTAPEQADFEVHPEWTIPATEPIDYGENIALGKETRQNGHTQIYVSRNAVDGDRFTYWEGLANSYPNELTVDLGETMEFTGFRILLNPRQIWSARTQEVEVLISDDGETFVPALEKTQLSFDPLADNSAYVAFPETLTGQYVRFVFHANSGATAGQAAEIEIYAPKAE